MAENKKKKNNEKKGDVHKVPVMETKVTNDMVIAVEGEEGRIYRFNMPFNSSLIECYNAACNVANEIARIFKETADRKKAEKEKEEAQEKTA